MLHARRARRGRRLRSRPRSHRGRRPKTPRLVEIKKGILVSAAEPRLFTPAAAALRAWRREIGGERADGAGEVWGAGGALGGRGCPAPGPATCRADRRAGTGRRPVREAASRVLLRALRRADRKERSPDVGPARRKAEGPAPPALGLRARPPARPPPSFSRRGLRRAAAQSRGLNSAPSRAVVAPRLPDWQLPGPAPAYREACLRRASGTGSGPRSAARPIGARAAPGRVAPAY